MIVLVAQQGDRPIQKDHASFAEMVLFQVKKKLAIPNKILIVLQIVNHASDLFLSWMGSVCFVGMELLLLVMSFVIQNQIQIVKTANLV